MEKYLMTMMMIIAGLAIFWVNLSVGEEIPTVLHSDSFQLPYALGGGDDYDGRTYGIKRSSLGAREFVRMVIMAFRSLPDGIHVARSIPYRPVRRIGSEFLGKRSYGIDGLRESDLYLRSLRAAAKGRVLGSEFLGKRRLGSEFLGKRMSMDEDDEENNESGVDDEEGSRVPFMMSKRRVLGSEFLGKRRLPGPSYDWSWKRARLGSEFLGKKKRGGLGSEFLGK